MSLIDLAEQPQTVPPSELKPAAEWPLPHWADKHVSGKYEPYTQLATRDGRRLGNGIIVFTYPYNFSGYEFRIHAVMTDFGNVLFMNEPELEKAFYPPLYRMKKELVELRESAMQAYRALEDAALEGE